ncbi:hypothetical protein RJ639_034220 [Escallonia herrerae]|uniref:PWWP domain-containing protein n=1 Tax=Escallonia herrerae TaxID=1293975 RepID=A0AA89BAZ5_9ASTE|nr:hypothetical protein RJ639_034220 [Escallonia herrerae]
MKGNVLPSNGSCVEKESGNKDADIQICGEIAFGDLIWVKLHESSWWPGQVVDENLVSRSSKPSDRSANEVLVRLYGSYRYLYVDPIRCHSEFENILKDFNGCYSEILEKALEQDIPRPKCGTAKGRDSKAKAGVIRAEASQIQNSKQKLRNRRQDTESPNFIRMSPRRPSSGIKPQTLVTNVKLHSEKTGGAKGIKRKEDGEQKKLQPGSISPADSPKTLQKPKVVSMQKKARPNGPESVSGYDLFSAFSSNLQPHPFIDLHFEMPMSGNKSSRKFSRFECKEIESHAKSWSDCSFWISIQPKWIHFSKLISL